MRKLIIALSLFLVPLTASDTLRVALKLSAPFAVETTDGYSGFTVEYLERMFDKTNIALSFTGHTQVDGTLTAVKVGEADFAAGSISVTREREGAGIDFALPYFDSGMGLLVKAEESGGFLAFLMNNWQTIGSLLLFMAVVGVVIWLIERDGNHTNAEGSFSDNPLEGITAGFWWVWVTMTTIGYGDYTPKKWSGRVITIIVFTFGVYLFGSALSNMVDNKLHQTSSIAELVDVYKLSVAGITGTTSEDIVTEICKNPVLYGSLEEAKAALDAGKVDAVVYDWPILHLQQDESTLLLPIRFNKQYYSIAFPDNSMLIELFNLFQLDMLESGEYNKLYNKYF
jgi:ABC-type amino acid transport substrate-binding protein